MKKNLMALLSVVLLLVLPAGCRQASSGEASPDSAAVSGQADERLYVVSTIFPGYDFARQVAGEHVRLDMLLSPGSESHSFEPSPQDIIKIRECDVFIYAGGEGDAWVDDILASIDTEGKQIMAMTDLVKTVPEEIKEGMEDQDHDDHDHEPTMDEHVWTSPQNAMQISRAIADTLSVLDSANAAAYRSGAEAYCAGLEQLDAAFREVVDKAVRKTLIFGDRFPFRYLADEYGLDYYAAFPGCSTDTEASAKTVAFLIDKVNAEQIPVVFHIEFSNEKMADTICESTSAEKRQLHSCHNLSKADFEGGVTYLTLMYRNVEALKEALC